MNIIEKLGNKGKIEVRDGKKWYVEEVNVANLFDSALQKKFGDEQNLIGLINKVIEERYSCHKKYTFDQIYDMHKLVANKVKRADICKKYGISYELLKTVLGEKENRSFTRIKARDLNLAKISRETKLDKPELINEMKNNARPFEEIMFHPKPCKSIEDIIHEHNLNASTVDEMIF